MKEIIKLRKKEVDYGRLERLLLAFIASVIFALVLWHGVLKPHAPPTRHIHFPNASSQAV